MADQEIFSPDDLAQIAAHQLSVAGVTAQLARFRSGGTKQNLDRPCRLGDGIRKFSEEDFHRLDPLWQAAAEQGRLSKFVPASGAGSRMFQKFIELARHPRDPEAERVLRELPRYPFFGVLEDALRRAGTAFAVCRDAGDYGPVLECLLGERGLNYARAPKALIPFHRYGSELRTALEEHLVETAALARDAHGVCRIHFTVAEDHDAEIRAFLERVRGRYETAGLRFEIGLSSQKKSTDTVAADFQHQLFRDRQGRLLFRAGGHGALLENLHHLGGDLVFLKNIDNVAPDAAKQPGYRYQRAMAGHLIELQGRIFHYLNGLEAASLDAQRLEEIAAFLQEDLSGGLPADWSARASNEKAQWLFSQLNRPLRVCGMVSNQGEPGGAPFWVRDRIGRRSLQIVESVQVDPGSAEQQAIFRSSTHFNPVDLVCGLRDYRSRPFDLRRFVDPDSGFISQKSHDGLPLLALELPGLWNGAMAFWNTVFVELPADAFTPVKQVEDLLRSEHQSATTSF